jgi:hypothetical protein
VPRLWRSCIEAWLLALSLTGLGIYPATTLAQKLEQGSTQLCGPGPRRGQGLSRSYS